MSSPSAGGRGGPSLPGCSGIFTSALDVGMEITARGPWVVDGRLVKWGGRPQPGYPYSRGGTLETPNGRSVDAGKRLRKDPSGSVCQLDRARDRGLVDVPAGGLAGGCGLPRSGFCRPAWVRSRMDAARGPHLSGAPLVFAPEHGREAGDRCGAQVAWM